MVNETQPEKQKKVSIGRASREAVKCTSRLVEAGREMSQEGEVMQRKKDCEGGVKVPLVGDSATGGNIR